MKIGKPRLNGKEVTQEEFHCGGKIGGEGIPMITKTCTDAKPWISESMGVLPHQVAKTRKSLPAHLSAVEVMDNGAVKCTDPGEAGRMGWIKYRNGIDADGGYRETYNSKT